MFIFVRIYTLLFIEHNGGVSPEKIKTCLMFHCARWIRQKSWRPKHTCV